MKYKIIYSNTRKQVLTKLLVV